jgi:Co/Zn/Cd efflux system component
MKNTIVPTIRSGYFEFVAGGLVYLTNSKYPDLIVGTIVFFIVGQGAFKILKLSK